MSKTKSPPSFNRSNIEDAHLRLDGVEARLAKLEKPAKEKPAKAKK